MNNKKTIFAKVGLVFAFGFLSAPIIKADVITTTIPYVDDNGVKYVNIEDLARASKGTVVENEESIDIVLNDAILSIYPEKGAAFLKTVIDNVTGETFEFPICEKITENDGGHLIPVSVVSKSFGIEGEETGYVIKTEVKTEKNNNKTSNSSSSNSIIESSTVHTNTANSSSSNNDSDENSNLNTKTEDGFENNNNNNNDNNTENNKNDSKINEGSDN